MTKCHALSLSFEFQLTRTNKKKASTRAPWQKTQAEDCDKACDQSSEFKVQRSCFSQVQIDCTSRAVQLILALSRTFFGSCEQT